MAKKVTLTVPRDKVPFDPFRTIKKIHWEDKKGQWIAVGVLLGNGGEGGNASIAINNIASTVTPGGTTSVSITLGSDGESSFPNVAFDLTSAQFNGEVDCFDGTKLQGFGLYGFNFGDAHNGAIFFCKPKGEECDVVFSGSSSIHTPAFASVYDNAFFKMPWGDFFDPHPTLSDAGATVLESSSFHFNLTDKIVTLTSG